MKIFKTKHLFRLTSLAFLALFTWYCGNIVTDQSASGCNVLSWSGTKLSGTTGNDIGYAITVDSSCNIYVTGNTQGNLDGQTNQGSSDIFLIKYDSAGSKQWTKLLGTSSGDYAVDLATDSLGNIYITGYTQGNLDGQTNAGSYDIFVIKYDSAGSKQWTKLSGTAGDEEVYGIVTDASNNVYVTGSTDGALDGQTYAGGSYDMFLIKYNSAGLKQWTKLLGTAGEDAGEGISSDSSGNIYVTGYTDGALEGSNAGNKDIFLTKYDSNGSSLLIKQFGTTSDDKGRGITTDSSGNIYVSGITQGALDGETNAGGNDIFVTKYDSNGSSRLWTKLLGTADFDVHQAAITDASGNLYVTGLTPGNLGGQTNAGGYDILVSKYDSGGSYQWTKLSGTTVNDSGNGITADSSGNVYVTGYTKGNLDGETNAGDNDIFIIKYDPDGNKL